MGLRFSEDKAVTRRAVPTLKARLGDAFEVIEIDSAQATSTGSAGWRIRC